MSKIHLDIVTPTKSILHMDVDEVTVPGILGEFCILAQHTPFLTTLGVGVLSLEEGKEEKEYVINGGFAEVSQDYCRILTETCESPDEIQLEEAQKDLAERERAFKKGNPEDFDEHWIRYRCAQARVELAKRAEF